MNSDRYSAILSARFIPGTIVATRPTTPHGNRPKTGWTRGKERDLKHNCWLIATADPTKKRKDVEHLVSFDAAIDFPCHLLSEARYNSDRLTKKLLILSCLTFGPRENGALDATGVAQMARKFDWWLRYRLAEGYSSFAEIPKFFASDFSRRLKSGGVLALVPIEERLEQLFEMRLRDNALPDEPLVLDQRLADTLGVPRTSLSNSDGFRTALLEMFSSPYGTQALALSESVAGLRGLDEGESEV